MAVMHTTMYIMLIGGLVKITSNGNLPLQFSPPATDTAIYQYLPGTEKNMTLFLSATSIPAGAPSSTA